MKIFCPKCNTDVQATEKEVIFKNGTKHIQADCSVCGRYIKYLPQPINPNDYVMPFGKYKGKTLLEIKNTDREYLLWLYDESEKERLKSLIDEVLSND